MKKNVVIILVLVFVVIAVVAYFFISSNKGGQTVTEKTESTGITNFFANAKGELLKQVLDL